MKAFIKKTIATVMSVVLVVSLTPIQGMADSSVDEGKGTEANTSQADTQSREAQVHEEQAESLIVNKDLASNKELLLQVNPVVLNDTIDKFASALSKFTADISKADVLSGFLTRFGGVTATVSGVLSVLKMTGVLKDPTWELLKSIQAGVQNVQNKLEQMDAKLDSLQKDLSKIAVAQQEIKRSNDADKMLHYWNTFNTNYCEPLEDKFAEYKSLISAGVMDWWQSSERDSIRVVYTLKDGKNLLTYSSAPYSSGFAATADNEEAINKDASFGVPASILPDTSKIQFNVDQYQDLFVDEMSKAFIAAVNNGDLDANKQFYLSWKKLSDTEKKAKAKEYARDILDTLIYQISRDVMTKNNAWVTSVINAYKNYCSNVVARNSGIDALLNALYLTHSFEGDVKNEIENFGDSMIVRAGYYGQLAMSCASQSRLQSLENRKELQNLFVETIDKLADKKKKSITGHDNYCYVTSTLVGLKYLKISSSISGFNGLHASDYTISPWNISAVPSAIMDGTSLQVLYNQFKTSAKKGSDFKSYLKKYGVIPQKSGVNNKIMTRYLGHQAFDLSECIQMTAIRVQGSYFTKGNKYKVNDGSNSDVENEYFHVHDKAVYDSFNLKNGVYIQNDIAASRALYAEKHGFFEKIDRAVLSGSGGWKYYSTGGASKGKLSPFKNHFEFWTYVYVLDLKSVHNMNADGEINDNNPFFAFDSPSLTEYARSAVGLNEDVNKTPITDIELQSDSYTYEGSPVEPKVVVKSNDTVVPEDSYDVDYVDNNAVGTAVVRVSGKGDYAGVVTKEFTITDKGESPAADGKVNSSNPSSSSPKTSGSGSGSYSSSMPKTGDPFLIALSGFFILGMLGAGSLSLARRRR